MRWELKAVEYSIQQVAKAAGTTSRTLRHYDEVGLLPPSRVGHNGYRYYNDESLVRLQRVLLLRQLGLGLNAIQEVLETQDAQADTAAGILGDHLKLLVRERQRLSKQIAAVERTISSLTAGHHEKNKEGLMAENIFDGFDHARYKDEVEQRWGRDAYAKSDSWWRGLGPDGQAGWKASAKQLGADWIAAAERGENPHSAAALELAERQVNWLRGIPGTPAHDEGGDLAGYLLGLGEMYVADERFAANYGGVVGATFVRDALRNYVETRLR